MHALTMLFSFPVSPGAPAEGAMWVLAAVYLLIRSIHLGAVILMVTRIPVDVFSEVK